MLIFPHSQKKNKKTFKTGPRASDGTKLLLRHNDAVKQSTPFYKVRITIVYTFIYKQLLFLYSFLGQTLCNVMICFLLVTHGSECLK